MKKYRVTYTPEMSLMTIMMLVLPIWDYYKSKKEERTFPVDNHIP